MLHIILVRMFSRIIEKGLIRVYMSRGSHIYIVTERFFRSSGWLKANKVDLQGGFPGVFNSTFYVWYNIISIQSKYYSIIDASLDSWHGDCWKHISGTKCMIKLSIHYWSSLFLSYPYIYTPHFQDTCLYAVKKITPTILEVPRSQDVRSAHYTYNKR